MSITDCVTKIHVLPGDVSSRIAAGEVIERPAAVVKELIDNSIDAGSCTISIEVQSGGLGLIRVTDDGEGMTRPDVSTAFQHHATSKLRSDVELMSISTMGFRGEALPSIAAVSKVTVTTATKHDAVGTKLLLVGGKAQPPMDASALTGTRIDVEELFYNQPARKKFLKSSATEFAHISHAVQQAALAWPSIHFRLTHNGTDTLNYPAATSDRDRIMQVYRAAFIEQAIEVRGRIPGLALRGYVIDPLHAGTSKHPQDVFVNGRSVRNATILHAVTEAFGAFLSKGRCPTFVLFVDVAPDRIDVNVHPTKKEVRFADPENVHRLVRHSIRHALGGEERRTVQQLGDPINQVPAERPTSGASLTSPFEATRDAQRQVQIAEDVAIPYHMGSDPAITPFGQLQRTYLVAQVDHELLVIDQHTAHERVLFERLWRNWETQAMPSQPLLIPEPVELSAQHAALIGKHLGDLERLGLKIEPFGATAIAICAVPSGIGPVDANGLVQDLLDDLEEWDTASTLETRVRPVLASLACHAAVRAGRSMAHPEIQQLIEDWIQAGLIMTCPHGRRTAFRLSTDDLDKMFGRVGWS